MIKHRGRGRPRNNSPNIKLFSPNVTKKPRTQPRKFASKRYPPSLDLVSYVSEIKPHWPKKPRTQPRIKRASKSYPTSLDLGAYVREIMPQWPKKGETKIVEEGNKESTASANLDDGIPDLDSLILEYNDISESND
ncbi:hypothetical protein GH714_031030 [Hevea brasiliensis]|uniref:Uncharacterized protein n=1 Tax=Hevea brasiliensis TaxID=3981 RepID=A0A6A6N8D4_HEVBR|nr:hypothetical protein GH714_031030 [Hevea brasiliensis]